MTTIELCESAGFTPRQLQVWIDRGLLHAGRVPRTSGRGACREFTADQAERARVLNALHQKGATLAQLARADLAGLAGKAYVVFDGSEFRACPDAAAAIAAVVHAKRRCGAVDLSAIRTAPAE